MKLIEWNDTYELGIKEIDNQHKGLVILINELFELMSQGKAKNHLEDIFSHLTDYTKKHFFAEEKLMVKYAYQGFDEHKAEHQKFIEKLSAFKNDFSQGKTTLSLEILNFLRDWLLNHIQITDQQYVPHVKKMSGNEI
ncbi:MAG: bacteriohemerythrin [Bacteroidales bacterium]